MGTAAQVEDRPGRRPAHSGQARPGRWRRDRDRGSNGVASSICDSPWKPEASPEAATRTIDASCTFSSSVRRLTRSVPRSLRDSSQSLRRWRVNHLDETMHCNGCERNEVGVDPRQKGAGAREEKHADAVPAVEGVAAFAPCVMLGAVLSGPTVRAARHNHRRRSIRDQRVPLRAARSRGILRDVRRVAALRVKAPAQAENRDHSNNQRSDHIDSSRAPNRYTRPRFHYNLLHDSVPI